MDAISKLTEKYDPLKNRTEQEERDSIIKESAPPTLTPHISSLTDYLNNHRDQGIILYEHGGIPGLRFSPGLNHASIGTERWCIAQQTIELLQEASDDLKKSIASGIEIPLLEHKSPPKHTKKIVERVLPPRRPDTERRPTLFLYF